MIRKYYLIPSLFIFSVLLLNCDVESADDSVTGPGFSTEPLFSLEHQKGLKFIIKTYNFPEVKYIQFLLEHDNTQLIYSSSTPASIGSPSFEISDSMGVNFAFSPSTTISGDVEIVGLSFSGGNYNNTKIKINNLYVLDQNNSPVEGIQYGTLCYIDDGIIDQANNNTSEPLKDWQPTGNYVWNYTFCGYID